MRGICKYCGKEKELCDAHIIPKAYYLDTLSETESSALKMFSSDGRGYLKKSQNGVYDKKILCAECDNKINLYDSYARKFLTQNMEKYYINGFFVIPKSEVNYFKLKKFIISILWRSSISKSSYLENINLGEHENTALKIIKNEISVTDNDWSLSIFKYADLINNGYNISKCIIATPILQTDQSKPQIQYYKIIFGGYAFYINIKNTYQTASMNTFMIRKGHNLIIPQISPNEFGDVERLAKLIEFHKEKKI